MPPDDHELRREFHRWAMSVERLIAERLHPDQPRPFLHQLLDLVDPYRPSLRLAAHLALVCGLVVSVGAQQLNPESRIATVSMIDRWLDPQTLIAAALVLLYVGGLREDIKRIKERLGQLTDEHLNTLFMPREVLEEKLKRLEHLKDQH